LLQCSYIFGKFSNSGNIVDSEYRMTQFTIGKIQGFQTWKFASCFIFSLFQKISKIRENCWFWVQNDSIYNRKNLRFQNLKICNLLQFPIIFGKFSKSGKTVNSEYRMIQFTIGKIQGFKTWKFAICFNFLSCSENCWFWVQNDSIYDEEKSRFRSMKMFNLLEVSLSFRKFPKSGKNVESEYRMS
jgi:hypothetical protein